jgi:DNA-binding MarR family transcriptional regulator
VPRRAPQAGEYYEVVLSLPKPPNVLWRAFVVSQLVGALVDREIARAGGEPRDFGVLSTIGSMGLITPTDLAELLGMPPTTLSATLARLEQAGAVRRRRNPNDGRSVLLELTAAGKRRWQTANRGLRVSIDRVGEELERPVPEVAATLETLERALRAALAE